MVSRTQCLAPNKRHDVTLNLYPRAREKCLEYIQTLDSALEGWTGQALLGARHFLHLITRALSEWV